METLIVEKSGIKYLTFHPNPPFIFSSKTIANILGECLGKNITRVLVGNEHIPDEFFKLQSLEAGEILQKFRTYGIRLAIVILPERIRSARFKEMATEEQRGNYFSIFTDMQKAEDWLLGPEVSGRSFPG